MEREVDEISLREIIEIIWNGKWIVIVITAIAVLMSGIASFILTEPVYESRSTVMLNNLASEESSQLSIEAYKEQVKNHAIMSSAINQLNLRDKGITINKLRTKINSEIIKGTNLIRITVSDNKPELAAQIANAVTTEYISFINEQSQDQVKSVLNYELQNLDDSIKLNKVTLNSMQQELANTARVLVTSKSLSQDNSLQSIVSDINNKSNMENGSIQYQSEEINPVYLSLQQSVSNLIVEIASLENKRDVTQDKINNEQLVVLENILLVSPAIQAEEPVGTNQKILIAISGIIGFTIGIFVIFIMHFVRPTTRREAKEVGGTLND